MRMEDKRQPAFEDTDLMIFGKYKGEPLQDVPASYFKWLWDETDIKQFSGQKPHIQVLGKIKLANYIFNSMDAIKLELKDK